MFNYIVSYRLTTNMPNGDEIRQSGRAPFDAVQMATQGNNSGK